MKIGLLPFYLDLYDSSLARNHHEPAHALLTA